MKIALFTKDLESGAFAHIAAALAKGFMESGIEDVCIIHLSGGAGRVAGFPEKTRFVPLGVRHARNSPLPLARFLRKEKPDVLISMPTFVSVFAILGCILAGKTKTKLIAYQGDSLSSEIRIDHKGNMKMRVLPWIVSLLYRRADGVMAVNRDVLAILKKNNIPFNPAKLALIPNPVDASSFADLSCAGPSHPWLVKKESPVIVSLARLVERKNYTLLIKAFAIIRKSKKARLVIFGEGPERRHLERLIAKLGIEQDVSLPGFVENPWSDIAKADSFVMSSLDEVFCLALAEAMACGVPTIATDAIGGGPRNVLDNGKYGILIPRDSDEKELAGAILKVLNSKKLQNRLIAAGKKRCKEFSPKKIAGEWLSFIRRLEDA